MLSRSKTPENFERLGALMAKLHDHGEHFEPPPGFSVPMLDKALPGSLPDLLFDGEPGYEIPGDVYALMRATKAELESELTRLYESATPRIIHGDLHWWNVLVHGETLHPIDFEDCALAFPIQDIAITFYYVLWSEQYQELLDAFRSGYEQQRPWPEAYPGQLDLLLGQRAIELVNLLLNSSYAEDRELIPEFIDVVDTVYRTHFERWHGLRKLEWERCNPSLS